MHLHCRSNRRCKRSFSGNLILPLDFSGLSGRIDQEMKRSLYVRLFLAACQAALLPAFAIASINSTTLTGLTYPKGTGQIRFHFDTDIIDNACETVILLGVGTAMRVSDYDKLGAEAVRETSTVFIMTDHAPNNLVKQSKPEQYAGLADLIAQQLSTWITVCRKPPKNGYIVGGHSASGQSAIQGLALIQNFKPAGYLGLDPFAVPQTNLEAYQNLPATMNWGFQTTTCAVTAAQAGKLAYEVSNVNSRVFFRIRNGGDFWPFTSSVTHCAFTDSGCPGCGMLSRETNTRPVRNTVGQATQAFVKAVAKGRVLQSDFLGISTELDFDLFVNQQPVDSDEVLLRRDPMIPALV